PARPDRPGAAEPAAQERAVRLLRAREDPRRLPSEGIHRQRRDPSEERDGERRRGQGRRAGAATARFRSSGEPHHGRRSVHGRRDRDGRLRAPPEPGGAVQHPGGLPLRKRRPHPGGRGKGAYRPHPRNPRGERRDHEGLPALEGATRLEDRLRPRDRPAYGPRPRLPLPPASRMGQPDGGMGDGQVRSRHTLRPASMKKTLLAALAAIACLTAGDSLAVNPPGTAQPPPSTGGIAVLDLLLAKLATHRRLLVVAAHPDDEDTALLTVVARGQGGEAAYLSLSRGDGGQNLIGPELSEALGVIRTRELDAARRMDGARQYFTRAYDFGYSKSVEEAFRFWPREEVLKDAVRVIRRFRPQIIDHIFSGTPRDGHGQHQESALIAKDAFKAAGDPAAFPELAAEGLTPWQPAVLYRSTRFLDREATTVVLSTTGLQNIPGRSYQQIAVASRTLPRPPRAEAA